MKKWKRLEPVVYNPQVRNNDLDEFLTPVELIEACIRRLTRNTVVDKSLAILDVGANDGRWGKVARLFFPVARIAGIELLDMPQPKGFDEWHNADFLAWETDQKYDLIISNPPYTIKTSPEQKRGTVVAESFVRKSLSLLKPNGIYAALLRSDFRHSKERGEGLLQEWHYKEAHNVSLRPSFYRDDRRTAHFGTRNTNAHEYTFFVWHELWKENYATLDMPLLWEYKET